MGDRVRVIHDGDGRLVAAKSPPPDDPARTSREAAVLSELHHPGVVELVGLPDSDRGPEIVTRWVGSRTAADLPRPLDPARAAGLLLAVAATIEDLHRLGVVHGGLDATHVLLDRQGRPVLCGFGDAAPLGAITGPDRDGAEVRPSLDVAGLGSLLLELLAGDDTPGWRWSPAPGRPARRITAQRRALQAIAHQAIIDDPTCRPGVRAFADAVRAAVPDAILDRRPDSPLDRRPDGPRPRFADPTEDRPPPPPVRPSTTPTTDPLLTLLAGSAEPIRAGDLGGPSIDAPSIDAPRVTDAASSADVYLELDLLRPPAAAGTDGPRSRRGRLGGVSLVLGLAVLGFLGVSVVSDDATPAPSTRPTASSATANASSVTTRGGTGPPRSVTPPTEIEHHGARYRVGQPGDLVAVGDWRCTGAPTPALYRPSTGSLFVFPDWPAAGNRTEVAPLLTSMDGRRLEAGPPDSSGCPTLVLHDGDGRTTVIDRALLS